MPKAKLITKAEWDELSPISQGRVCYLQGAIPGSELEGLECPYPAGSKEQKDFAAGEFSAMMDAQDSEE